MTAGFRIVALSCRAYFHTRVFVQRAECDLDLIEPRSMPEIKKPVHAGLWNPMRPSSSGFRTLDATNHRYDSAFALLQRRQLDQPDLSAASPGWTGKRFCIFGCVPLRVPAIVSFHFRVGLRYSSTEIGDRDDEAALSSRLKHRGVLHVKHHFRGIRRSLTWYGSSPAAGPQTSHLAGRGRLAQPWTSAPQIIFRTTAGSG